MTTEPSNSGPDNSWVSATATRNYLLRDPIVDWLNLYGAERGYERDDAARGYDTRLDFTRFIMDQGIAFEAAVAEHFRRLKSVVTIADDRLRILEPEAMRETLAAMHAGHPVIHQGVLHDPGSQTFGAPDFLVRSDMLEELFPGSQPANEVMAAAPGLGARYHYVVVDAKFTTLHLLKSGEVGNSGSAPAYKSQLYIYNRALGKLQGYTPGAAFLLGRGWEQTKSRLTTRVTNAFDRLGRVAMNSKQAKQADAAVAWVRRVRKEGAGWHVLPEPSVPELYPNATADGDFPWHTAKSQIADELEELTLLWKVGADKRDTAVSKGIKRWTEPRASARALGVTGEKTGPTLQAMIDVNRDGTGAVVLPGHVTAAEADWRRVPVMEFYVDFETVSNLKDDLTRFPEQNGQPLIYMIGCGHIHEGEWVFKTFCTDHLTEADEAKAIDAWLQHMADASRAAGERKASVIHWSFAEPVNYETAYDSARKRHPEKGWPELHWFDLWDKIFRPQPVVVRGALGFGLKAVARALHSHGLIETSWGDSKVDGLGAMVGAWRCDEQAVEEGTSMRAIDLMQEITDYNEVDCKVMMEILCYLRANH